MRTPEASVQQALLTLYGPLIKAVESPNSGLLPSDTIYHSTFCMAITWECEQMSKASNRAGYLAITVAAWMAAVAALAATGLAPPSRIQAGPVSPTATPTGTAVIDLAAPEVVAYFRISNTVIWVDNSTGEEGFRVTVVMAEETRTFEAGPNVEELQLPDDFRPSCPSSNVQITVIAFRGTEESAPGFLDDIADCAPGTITPSPTSTPAPVSLPGTGGGAESGASSPLPAALALLAAALGLGGLALLRRRAA
jgi:hypothetical protein